MRLGVSFLPHHEPRTTIELGSNLKSVAMSTHSNWIDWLVNHPSNKEGNRNLQSFSNILGAGISNDDKLKHLVKEIDTVILAADANENVLIFHRPKNFGGT